ncbi:protein CHROMATIN REMODELING 25 isoform X2 [Gastrolobium bilobum]|uniref:protein CHROMATIN REMODELING 25 isoform X2 n=1 Tax=Gastrolobium bilobum TaxID=150636 RepID=UPI002AAFF19F|nr:protein CHROMATIN REMODELING 25 isoform X2 [Gastrolobium bilobum]
MSERMRMEEEEDEVVSCSSDPGDDDIEKSFDSGDSDYDIEQSSSPLDEERKSQNVEALLRGNLIVKRQSLLPRVLSVSGAAVCRKPFKPPCYKSNGYNQDLTRRLSARKRFVPWGSTTPTPVVVAELNLNVPPITISHVDVAEEEKPSLPPGVDPLVLWHPEDEASSLTTITVDPLLVRFLRPHQREGVQFMFDCVSGLCSTPNIHGCILADDMGLGKTLQSIALLYTLIFQGFDGKPMVRKAIIVTPTSLVSNWEAEIHKWVGERVHLVALCESTREDVVSAIENFTSPHSTLQVLIVSYETFRMHSSKFSSSDSCDLLICDEAHRLKNDQTITNKALAALPCKRRILLSGTPLQNDLEEFFAMVNFTNPGILGDIAHFRRYYEAPIICGREPAATAEEKKLGAERTAELSAQVNRFILRRTNALLSNHLPPKIVEVVCCKLTPLQSDLYKHFIQQVKQAFTAELKQSKILAHISALKKLCNHPKLIYDNIRSGSPGTSGFEDCIRFFPPEMLSGRSGSWTGGHGAWVELSGKMHVLARLLAQLRQRTNDRIVLVSNYTQTLDLFSQLCRERRYPHLRLDGTTSISKRQKLVNCFNDLSKDEFVFLLSSKAGGCGLNLIGGNRLVLFDPDWNPANDKQAAARVWRDGQKKRVYIYRFLSAGTIEEKVYQRQMSKEGLQKVIQQEQTDSLVAQGNFLSTEDLRNLFTFNENVKSEIHEKMQCARCQTYDGPQSTDEKYVAQSTKIYSESDEETSDIGGFAEIAGCLENLKTSEKQVGTPLEEDLGSWGHHFFPTSVPDAILRASAGDEVTFVFTNQVNGKLVPIDSVISPKLQQKEPNNELLKSGQNIKQKSAPFSLHNKLPLRSANASGVTSALSSSPNAWTKEALNSVRIIKNNSMNVAFETDYSLVNKLLPQKRSCPANINDDD